MNSIVQTLIVAVIVALSAAYAIWSLMPGAWRASLRRRLGLQTVEAGGCGACGGGCSSPAPPPGAAQPIRVHRRPPA
jgi:hypothetical protein